MGTKTSITMIVLVFLTPTYFVVYVFKRGPNSNVVILKIEEFLKFSN